MQHGLLLGDYFLWRCLSYITANKIMSAILAPALNDWLIKLSNNWQGQILISLSNVLLLMRSLTFNHEILF